MNLSIFTAKLLLKSTFNHTLFKMVFTIGYSHFVPNKIQNAQKVIYQFDD